MAGEHLRALEDKGKRIRGIACNNVCDTKIYEHANRFVSISHDSFGEQESRYLGEANGLSKDDLVGEGVFEETWKSAYWSVPNVASTTE